MQNLAFINASNPIIKKMQWIYRNVIHSKGPGPIQYENFLAHHGASDVWWDPIRTGKIRMVRAGSLAITKNMSPSWWRAMSHHSWNSDCSLVRMLGKLVFGRFPWIFIFYTINEAHKQYSLLDTIFNYIFYLGPPGKYLYLSPQNLLHVGRRSRPTCSRFSWLFYRYFPGGPK